MPLPAYEAKSVPQPAAVTSFGQIIDPKAALRNCEVGKSFVVDAESHRQRLIGFAHRLKIKIRTKRNGSGRFDIWRTE